MEQEFLIVMYAFEKFYAYFLGKKVIAHTNHSVLQYLIVMKETNPWLFDGSFYFKSLILKLRTKMAVKIKWWIIYLTLSLTKRSWVRLILMKPFSMNLRWQSQRVMKHSLQIMWIMCYTICFPRISIISKENNSSMMW